MADCPRRTESARRANERADLRGKLVTAMSTGTLPSKAMQADMIRVADELLDALEARRIEEAR